MALIFPDGGDLRLVWGSGPHRAGDPIFATPDSIAATPERIAGAPGQPHHDYPDAGHMIQQDVGDDLAARIAAWIAATPRP